MTVHFIGAGPGAPDLITVRGRDLIARCPVCLYAGSLVPEGAARPLPAGRADRRHRAARSRRDRRALRRGDRERARTSRGCIRAISRSGARWASRCAASTRQGVPYTVTPGVPAFAAAAAALRRELTLPGLAQSLVLTRTSGRASPMPERETLAAFAATGATLAIHLSIHALERVVAELTAVLRRAIVPPRSSRAPRGRTSGSCARRSANSSRRCARAPIERTALILVGPALGAEDFRESELYNADYVRRFPGRRARGGRMRRSTPSPIARSMPAAG